MIAHTALVLLIIGLLNCFNYSAKSSKFVGGFSLFALSGLILWFLNNLPIDNERIFSFLWNSSPSGDIKVDIVSNLYNCELFLPFLIITVLAMCLNFCFGHKICNYNAILLFNSLIILLMITSNNFVQLLSAFFLIDIFAVIKNNANACKKFIMINLCSDMIIFMLMALINGRIDSLDIREIINYKNTGYHSDFIAILGFTSIAMKMGFFPFQIGLASLSELHFHRQMNILFLFSPVSALILLLKFAPLWTSSSYFLPYFDASCIATLLWGAFRSLSVDDVKSKFVYWQIMLFALLLELLHFHGFVWNWFFSQILLANYVLFIGFYLLYHIFGKTGSLSEIIRIKTPKIQTLLPALILIFLAVCSHINNLEMLYNNRNRYYIWTYAVLFLLSFCGTIHQICFSHKKSKLSASKTCIHPQHYLLILLSLGVSAETLLSESYPNSWIFWTFSGTFIFLCLSQISFLLIKPLQNKKFQHLNLFEKIYRFLFVFLLQETGRLLWLIVDWKIVEKFITGAILGIWYTGLRLFRSTQTNSVLRFFWILCSVLIVLCLTIYLRGKA